VWELKEVICTSIDDESTAELFPLETPLHKGMFIADAVTNPLRTSRRFHRGLMGPFKSGYFGMLSRRPVPGKIDGLALRYSHQANRDCNGTLELSKRFLARNLPCAR